MFLIPDSWYAVKVLPKKGRGIFAARDIEATTVIGDYLGILIKPGSNQESKNGLYDMAAGARYDILAKPSQKGVQWINHACVQNCDVYPYRGHMLIIALRKIFRGEELAYQYGQYAPDETVATCYMHACYCDSDLCTGTMHNASINYDRWKKLVKKEFGSSYGKLPVRYGQVLPPLPTYPTHIDYEKNGFHDFTIFGAEKKRPVAYSDSALPPIAEIKKRIGETGQRLAFPKIHFSVSGVEEGMVIGKRI